MNEVTGMEIVWVLLGGVLSGFLNTLASSGSAVTLPLLVFVGLSPSVANATNRIGIVMGAVTSTAMFYKEGLLKLKPVLRACVWPWAGAFLGAEAATRVSDRATELTILVAVLLAFILVIFGAKRFLRTPTEPPKHPSLRDGLILFVVGVWAGYIVLDSATYLLLALVLCLNLDLKHANAYKAVSLLGIALISIIVFQSHHQLNLTAGVMLAVGNVVGAWAGAKCAVLPHAEKWVYRLLVFIVSAELLKMIHDFVWVKL